MSFAKKIIEWYHEHQRDLPWRNTRDPYKIWLSEIILQQTRVEQGMPYYLRFVERYPDVLSFANASEDDILHLWQGLGYYSRGRNMHKAAGIVRDEYQGEFPKAYDELIKLPGIGEYTAAAISSFSNDEAQAVLDGNVFRVLARYFGIDTPINTPAGKKIFSQLAKENLDRTYPALYNQAIMDFGALQCKPKSPLCQQCELQLDCYAKVNDVIADLPVKIKAKKSRNRYFHYFIIQRDEEILMSKRGASDVWENLYEFPMIETSEALEGMSIAAHQEFLDIFGSEVQLTLLQTNKKHILSHQHIYATFYRLLDPRGLERKKINWNYVLLKDLDKLAKHKLIFSFLETAKL
ncbi:A/G-specific adenine glycosylase [compost metagenome]|jgi:A/G-specific adenine glycosylase|uniref:A/G-specific adenine glycosylase n=1 Tax=Sphingobacterium faecium TaxID=34087 RepID=UPI000D3BB4F5|nr:A/G-specific adenine glycosylase [Sphingobacterium faecium]PTX10916.1 A/G-specific DNA-adenine glycosylase [Sphingobacterium faecium]GEM62788.1 A/G-specific adenine glycosylase [Sphingobacterium faecium NBRC 15299]